MLEGLMTIPKTPAAASRADSDTRDALHRTSTVAAIIGSISLAAFAAWLIRLRTMPDVDLWLHLRVGAALRDGERFGVVPDPLVLIADRPYMPTQWLGEVAGSVVHEVAGMTGIHAMRAVAVVVVAAAVVATARVSTSPVRAVAIGLLVVFATSAAWGDRPQLAGLAFAAVTVLAWSRSLSDARIRWWLVPMTWVWAMTHGSWALGLAISAVASVACGLEHRAIRARPLPCLGLLGGMAAAVALTPLGPRLLLEPFAVSAAASAGVSEWQRPQLNNPLYVLVLLLAAFALVRAVRRTRVDLPAVVLTVTAVAMAAYSVRTVAFGVLLLTPALARAVRASMSPIAGRDLLALAVGALVFVAMPGVVWGGPTAGPLGRAVDAGVSALPAGTHVAVGARGSGWVLWAHPQALVVRDLRAEVYSPTVAARYEDFFDAKPGWQTYADEQDIRAVVVEEGDPLDEALAASGTWKTVASSQGWVLWQRP